MQIAGVPIERPEYSLRLLSSILGIKGLEEAKNLMDESDVLLIVRIAKRISIFNQSDSRT